MLHQMEVVLYDCNNATESMAEKMHNLKVNFAKAMKSDDEHVKSRMNAAGRRSSVHKITQQTSESPSPLLNSDRKLNKITEVYKEIV